MKPKFYIRATAIHSPKKNSLAIKNGELGNSHLEIAQQLWMCLFWRCTELYLYYSIWFLVLWHRTSYVIIPKSYQKSRDFPRQLSTLDNGRVIQQGKSYLHLHFPNNFQHQRCLKTVPQVFSVRFSMVACRVTTNQTKCQIFERIHFVVKIWRVRLLPNFQTTTWTPPNGKKHRNATPGEGGRREGSYWKELLGSSDGWIFPWWRTSIWER